MSSAQALLGQWVYTLGLPQPRSRSQPERGLVGRVRDNCPSGRRSPSRLKLAQVLVANRAGLTQLQDLFHALFASIPHQWYTNKPIAQYEGYYASIFYSHFAALGLGYSAGGRHQPRSD